jgi:hypothetical protein
VGTTAADAYRELRRAQHRARLDEQTTQLDPETMAAEACRCARALACRLRLIRERPATPGGSGSRPPCCSLWERSACLGLSTEALDWQPTQVLRQPWRAWSAALVHLSSLHLAANLAGAALVGALGGVAQVAATQRRRLALRLAADPAGAAGPT